MKTEPRFFHEPPDDAGLATGSDDSSFASDVLNDGAKPDDVVTPPAPPAVQPTIDYDKFGQVLAGAFAQHAPKPEPKQMTQEEARKLLKYWEPDDQFVAKFGNLETQKEAIAEMRDKLFGYYDSVSQARMAQLQRDYDERFARLEAYYQRQEDQQLEATFFKKYPALAKPEFRPVYEMAAGHVAAGGKKFSSADELFTHLATGIERVLQSQNPDFKLTGAAAPKPGNPNAIPTTTRGGGGVGGGNRSGGGGATKSHVLSVLG